MIKIKNVQEDMNKDYNAAKCIIYNPFLKKYLVGKHNQGPPYYSLLGGRKDANENPWLTLKREFYEETSGALDLQKDDDDQYYLVSNNQNSRYILDKPKIIYEKNPYEVVFYIFELKDKVPENFINRINLDIQMNQDKLYERLGIKFRVPKELLRNLFENKPKEINTFISSLVLSLINNYIDITDSLNILSESLVYLENNGIEFVPINLLNQFLLEKNILKYIA